MPASVPDRGESSPWKRALPPLLLLSLVTAFYLPAAKNGFLYDDHKLILDQRQPQSWRETLQVFGERHWYNLPYYRPVSRLTMVVQKYVSGNVARPYHVFNAVVMGAVSGMAYLLLRLPLWNIPAGIAAMTAGLFAIHPAAANVVYPICSGRETSIPAFFVIACMYAFLHRGHAWYAVANLLLCLALLSKEQAIILPALFVLADALGLSEMPVRNDPRRWLLRYLPVAIIVTGYFVIRWKLFADTGEHNLAILEAPWRPLASFAFAMQTAFLPYVELRYEPRLAVWLSPVRLLLSTAMLVVIVVQARSHWSSLRKSLLFWLAWIVLSLLPTANILKQDAMFAERYIFLSLLGAGAIIAVLVSTHWQSGQVRKAFWVIGTISLVYCGTVSFHRAAYFQNDEVFLSQWIHTDPQSAQARLSLGEHLFEQQEFDAAWQQLNAALQLAPDLARVHNTLGVTLLALGDIEGAGRHSRLSLELDPQDPENHNNMGIVLAVQGELDEAAESFREAIRLNPAHVKAHFNLGRTSLNRNQYAEAVKHFQDTILLAPDYVEAYVGLGDAQIGLGAPEAANAQYRTALRLDPRCAAAYHGLGRLQEGCGELREAARLYEQALAIDSGLARARDNLQRVRQTLER